jgi:hypothetical protein
MTSRRPHPAVLLLVALLSVGAARAGIQLELIDGRRLTGSEIRRDGGLYRLTLEDGTVVPVPEALVRQIRLTGDSEREPAGPAVEAAAPHTLAGDPAKLKQSEPEVLAGRPTALPRTAEQLAVFGVESAGFRHGWYDFNWRPSSDWNLDLRNNQFNPARWAQGPIPFRWIPRPAYTTATDVTEFSPADWKQGIDTRWSPIDGFANSVGASFSRPSLALPPPPDGEPAEGAPGRTTTPPSQ